MNSNLSLHPPRSLAHGLMRVLSAALVVCIATPIGLTQGADAPAAPPASAVPDASSPARDGAVIEIPLEPIVIESEMLNPEPTLDQLMQKFRALLAAPPSFLVSERQLSDGTLEMFTWLGRLCARPPPMSIRSGLGGDITLAAPCASF